MLGFLLRLLPFWVREPLLVLVGSVFGVRILYIALFDEGDWKVGLIGLAFLLFTAVRVHTVVRAWRARRDPVPPAAVVAPPPAPAVPIAPPAQEKAPDAWLQAVAAVAVFAAIGGALWLHDEYADSPVPAVASCTGGETEKPPSVYARTPRPVTGDELCAALNRPGLAQLLGTPAETATVASGTSGTAPLTDGKVAQPEAEVQFDTYTVHVSATYNHLSIAQYVKLMKYGQESDVRTLTVLGRPAVLSSDHTMRFEIGLGGGTGGGPAVDGPLARTLSVALDGQDRGGYYDVTVWSESGILPDDSVLLGVAEKVLTTIPGRHG